MALGLVLSMGAVVVTADAQESAPTSVVDGAALVRASADRAAYTEQLREEAVDAAEAAVVEVSRVRSDATQAAVPAEVIAELDAATAELQAALAQVDAEPVVERNPSVSRSAERGEPAATTTPDPAATPEVTAPGTFAAQAGPQAAQPTADAAPPTADPARPTADPAQPTADPADGDAAPGTDDVLTDATLPDATDPVTTPLREALDRVRQAAQVVLSTTEQKRAEAAAAQVAAEVAAARAERAAAEQAAQQAVQRATWKASLQGYDNGQIPSSALCGLSFDSAARLRCDAAEALDALDAAFAARFGTHLTISDSYRSYGGQVACRASKGSLCAAPGTSNHGWGLAVDLGGSVQSFGSAQHQWMRENAPAFQWTLPEWARAGGSKPEPWHWEYVG